MALRLFYLILCMGLCSGGDAQIITTFAGTGTSIYGGDGGPATAATMHFPIGLAVDRHRNVYISADYRVRKVDTNGIITTVAGSGAVGFSGDGGPATNAAFNGIIDLVVDKNDNLYIYDYGNYRIRKVDTAGIIRTIVGNGSAFPSGDGGPATNASLFGGRLTVDKYCNVYFMDSGSLRKIDTFGIVNRIAGTGISGYSGDGGPATAAQIAARNVDIDTLGNIYISDVYRVRKIDTAGIITTIAGNGTVGYSGDGGPATAAQVSIMEGVNVDVAGNVYIVDWNNYVFRKINTLGIITTIIGNGVPGFSGDGGPATAASVGYICRLAKYGDGNIYITDRNASRVRMVTDTNHAVHFTGGHSLLFNVCAASVPIDSLLSGSDADTGQVDNWSLLYSPLHGTVNAAYATYSTGSVVVPAGLTYSPMPGYTGYDTFTVRMSDGFTSDTTTIYVRVDTSLPFAGTISGADSVCAANGTDITLADTIGGGVWYVTNPHASVTGGVVTGITPGRDTVRYIVTNGCGMDTATHAVEVVYCPDGVTGMDNTVQGLRIWPSPAYGAFSVRLVAPTDEDAAIVLTDLTGQRITGVTTTTNKTATIRTRLPAGVYFINAVTARGVWSGKVVVR